MGMKPRKKPALKKVPCKECNGTGRVNRHWAAGGGRIGYRSWMEPCPSCRARAIRIEAIDGVDRVKFVLSHMKGGPIDEKYRYEIEGETWINSLKRYRFSVNTETQEAQPTASTTPSSSVESFQKMFRPKM